MIYKPILSPLPPLDPPTDLATIIPTCRSCHCQTHLPISLLSDPPNHLAFFRPTHRSVVLYQYFLSIYLSLSLSHDRCLYLRKTGFFLLCFIVDLVYIFRFSIIIFVWKLRKCEKMCFLENFQIHDQTPKIIFISEKYFHLKIFYTLKLFYIKPNVA